MPNQTVLLVKMQELIQNLVGVKLSEQLQKKLLDYVSENYQTLGFKSELDFVNELEKKHISSPEIKSLITKITIAESYFFRHKKILGFIEQDWLPMLLTKKRQQGDFNLRIWSAGCSAGQELYSVAILLSRSIKDIKDWNIHLLGTDIDGNGLKQAKIGQYRAWSFREKVQPDNNYFKKNGPHYVINEKIKAMAKFNYLNLMDSNYPSMVNGTNNLDLILCCNVFIYLNHDVVSTVLQKFSRCLKEDGILILGPSDILNTIPEELVQSQKSGITFYKKNMKNEASSGKIVENETSQEEKQNAYLVSLFKQLNEENWTGALATIEKCKSYQGESALLFQLKANALANLGDLKNAMIYCDKSLAVDSSDAHTYLIKAMIYLGLKDLQSAEQSLRQGLILNSDFVELRFHLALVLLSQGNFEEGLHLLYSVREAIKNYNPDRKVHHAPRLNFKEFASIIENEISVYEQEAKRKAIGDCD